MIQWSQLAFAETVSIALFAGVVWATYLFSILRSARTSEAVLRGSLLFIALCCLCLIIFKPRYSVSQPGGKALLLTQDVPVIADSLPVFALPDVKSEAVTKVPDLAFIERNHPEITHVYIDGYGLEPEQTKHLQRLQVTFLEKETPAGFNWLSYSRQVREGEELIVSGIYFNKSPDTLKLRLATLEGVQDSVLLPSGEKQFSLQAPASLAGNFTASLQVVAGDSTRTELLPYIIEVRQPLQLLMLQGFPSFEMNYLKDYLSQSEHRIQVRARISRDKYAMQVINGAQQSSPKPILSKESLTTADLLICDAESLRQLSATEKNRIQHAVEQGLGILVLTDERWLKKPEILGHTLGVTPSRTISFAPRQTAQAAQGKVMADKLPASFAATPSLVPVAYSRAGELITAYVPNGKGRIGAQLAAATFPWILQGEVRAYSHFWTSTIEAISRRRQASGIRLSVFPFVLKDVPSAFTISDTLLAPATIRYASGISQVSMPQKGLPGTMETSYRFLPVEEGWVGVGYGEDTTQHRQMYVLPANAWDDLKKAYWWRQQVGEHAAVAADKAYTFTSWKELQPLWLFMLLVLSLGFLWWREKK